MTFDRRTVLKGLGAATAAGVASGTATAAEYSALDDGFDLSGGPQEALVVFGDGADVDRLGEVTDRYHAFESLPIGYAELDGETLREVAGFDGVRYVEQNRRLKYHNDDSLRATGAGAVHEELGFTGESAHAVVIDSGIDGTHPDHREDLQHNYRFTNPLDEGSLWVDVGNGITDDYGHGTHVSGSVAGTGDASDGEFRGMAPDASLTVYSTGVYITVLDSVGAYDHLLTRQRNGETNVQVVNNSYGPISGNSADFNPNGALEVATYRAFEQGILSFFSAGNSGPGSNTLSIYGRAPYNVGVAANRDNGVTADFSSRGRTPAYDGDGEGANYDREAALENLFQLKAAQRADTDDDGTDWVTYRTRRYDGRANANAGAVRTVDGTPPFTVPAVEGADDYRLKATVEWSVGGDVGAQAAEVDIDLLDINGNSYGSTGGSATTVTSGASKTLVVEEGISPETLELYVDVIVRRGAITNWKVTVEYQVPSDDPPTAPDGPVGLYRPGIGAPGVFIMSTLNPAHESQTYALQALNPEAQAEQTDDPYYGQISGTSMSSPTATGIGALVVDAYAQTAGTYPSPRTVIDILESTADFRPDELSHTVYNVGRGFVDAFAAVERAVELASEEEDDAAEGTDPGRSGEAPGQPGDD